MRGNRRLLFYKYRKVKQPKQKCLTQDRRLKKSGSGPCPEPLFFNLRQTNYLPPPAR